MVSRRVLSDSIRSAVVASTCLTSSIMEGVIWSRCSSTLAMVPWTLVAELREDVTDETAEADVDKPGTEVETPGAGENRPASGVEVAWLAGGGVDP